MVTFLTELSEKEQSIIWKKVSLIRSGKNKKSLYISYNGYVYKSKRA